MSIEISIEQAAIDPLRSSVELPRRITLYPLGFPLLLETNSENVIRAALDSWAEFPQGFDEPPAQLSLGVEGESLRLPPPPVFSSRRHLLSIVSDPQNTVFCDMQTGFGFGWVTENVAAARPFFRYHFLDAAALMLIAELYLTPVHGALIERGGQGVLLCGDSFAGKSTLAYACARSGWTLISDDGTFLVRRREDCYGIGNPFSLRFREDARLLFPELSSHLTGLRPNGKAAIEVATRELPEIATATGAIVNHVVFLNRYAGGNARLTTLSRSEALNRLQGLPVAGLESVREEHRQAYRRLLTGGVWQLNYGDLRSAVERLDILAARGN
jgi:hypothetical protein